MAGWYSTKKKYSWNQRGKTGLVNGGILTTPGTRLSQPVRRPIWPWVLLSLFCFCFIYYLIKGPPPSKSDSKNPTNIQNSTHLESSHKTNRNQSLLGNNGIERWIATTEEMDGVDDLGLPKRTTWILVHNFAERPALFINSRLFNELKKSLHSLEQNQKAARIWPHHGSLQTLASQAQELWIQHISENEYSLMNSEKKPTFSILFDGEKVQITAYESELTYSILSITPDESSAKPFQLAFFHPANIQTQPLLTLSANLLEEVEDAHSSWIQPKEEVKIILENHLKWLEPNGKPGIWQLRSEKQKSKVYSKPSDSFRLKVSSREEKDKLLKNWSDVKDERERTEEEIRRLNELVQAYSVLYDSNSPFYNLGERILSLDTQLIRERIDLLENIEHSFKKNSSHLLDRLELQKLRKLSMLQNFATFQKANLRSASETSISHYADYVRYVLLEAEIEPEEFVNPANAIFFTLLDWSSIPLKFASPQYSASDPLASQITSNRVHTLATWNEIFSPSHLNMFQIFYETQSTSTLAETQLKLREINQTLLKLKERQLELENHIKETIENKLDAGNIILEWISPQTKARFEVILFEKE